MYQARRKRAGYFFPNIVFCAGGVFFNIGALANLIRERKI
jgi:hypothetical protein